jgi:hypothetical protein
MAYSVIELTIGTNARFSVRQLVLVNAGDADLAEIGMAVKRARSASSFFVLQTWEAAPGAELALPPRGYALLEGVTTEQLMAGDFATAGLKEAPTLLDSKCTAA